MVLSAVAYLDRTNVAIAGVHLGKEFNIDNARLGWIFSAFLWVCLLPDSRRRAGAAVWATQTADSKCDLVGDFYCARRAAAAGREWGALAADCDSVLLGAGEATMYPAANQFVERWFPIEERGKANGIIFAGVGLGAG